MTHYTQNGSMVPKAAVPPFCPLPRGMFPSIYSPKLDASGDFLPTRLAKYSGPDTMCCKTVSGNAGRARGLPHCCCSSRRHRLTTALGLSGGPWLSMEPCTVSEGLTLAVEGQSESISQGPRGRQKRKHQQPSH